MKQPSDSEIRAALIDRTAAYDVINDWVTPVNTPESSFIQQMLQARDVVDRLARSTVTAFGLPRKVSETPLQCTDIGSEVLQALLSPISLAAIQYPGHQFDPRLDLYLDCMKRRDLSDFWLSAQSGNIPISPLLVDGLNGFVEDVRQRANSIPFKRKLATFKKQAARRFSELQDYLNQINALYPAGHVQRFTFCYRRFHAVGYGYESGMNQQVSSHCKELMKQIKKSLGDAFVGHAWKRDFGKDRGFHFHVVIFLNGPQLSELSNIVESFRLQWGEITGGIGLVHQHYPNLRQCFRHGRQATTIWDVWDKTPSQLVLDPVPTYMVLTDGLVAFAPPGEEKQYGMGTLPKTDQKKMKPPGPKKQEIGVTSSDRLPFFGSTGLI